MTDFDTPLIAAITAFGEPCSWQQQYGTPVAVNAVFDEPFQDLSFDSGNPVLVMEQKPAATIRLADLAVTPQQGDQFIARGTLYVIREVRPDGQGAARLILNEAPEQ